jgi:hypothetical protein
MVVGNMTLPPNPGTEDQQFLDGDFLYQGVLICRPFSLLWECEIARFKLNPLETDPSLFVKQAGDLKLRSDEFDARMTVYRSKQYLLANAVGLALICPEELNNPLALTLHNRYRRPGLYHHVTYL